MIQHFFLYSLQCHILKSLLPINMNSKATLVRLDHKNKDLSDRTSTMACLARSDNNVCLTEKKESQQHPGSCNMSCERLSA